MLLSFLESHLPAAPARAGLEAAPRFAVALAKTRGAGLNIREMNQRRVLFLLALPCISVVVVLALIILVHGREVLSDIPTLIASLFWIMPGVLGYVVAPVSLVYVIFAIIRDRHDGRPPKLPDE